MTTCHDSYVTSDVRPVGRQLGAGHRIVVGVDGSHESFSALRWAADQAFLSGARLDAVVVYEPVAEISFAFGGYPAVNPVDPEAAKQSALHGLEDVVHQVLRDGEDDIHLVAIPDGSPSRALTHAAEGASMLVVGAHHRHGLGMLLGSTASSCVRHAVCPVVVVPTVADADGVS